MIIDLDAINHDHAQIAYLSACFIIETKINNLVDENIHHASTFQLVKFSHVIEIL